MAAAKFGKIALVLVLLPFSLFAQTLQPDSSRQGKVSIRDERQIRKTEPDILKDSSQKKGTPVQRLTLFKQKRNKEQQKRLFPNTEDSIRYTAFLQQPKTGLIRLTEDIGCDANALILRADEECLNSIPGGSFYSFRERDYSSSALADIRLKDGLFITDGILSQNILVNLGDTSLESLSVNSDGMKFLADFVPEPDSKDATSQYIKLTRGIRVGKFEYFKVLPAAVNTTYAMRLVAYRGKFLRLYRGFVYDALSGDDRSDLVLAFRIVRKENGSVTLLWKELERKKAPKIVNSSRKR